MKNFVQFNFIEQIAEALRIVGGDLVLNAPETEDESINGLALAAIQNITQDAEVAVDLHSAVYMYHFTQALIKHVSEKDAYSAHVGMRIDSNIKHLPKR